MIVDEMDLCSESYEYGKRCACSHYCKLIHPPEISDNVVITKSKLISKINTCTVNNSKAYITHTHTVYEWLSLIFMDRARLTGLTASASAFHDGGPCLSTSYSFRSHLSNTARTRPLVNL